MNAIRVPATIALLMLMSAGPSSAFDSCGLCGGGPNNPPNGPPPPPPPPPPPCPQTPGPSTPKCFDQENTVPNNCAGDPVSLDGSSLNIQRSDFVLQGAIPIKMQFNFHSKSDMVGHFGYGWYFNYDIRVMRDEAGNFLLRMESGERRKYSPSGRQLGGQASKDVFRANSDGTYTLVRYDGLIYEFNSWGIPSFAFDQAGNFLRFVYAGDGDGNPLKFPIYGATRLMPYTDYFEIAAYDYRLIRIESGLSPDRQSLAFEFNEQGYVQKATDHTGRAYLYSYNQATGTLNTVTNPVGEFVYYNYGHPQDPFRITSFVAQAKCARDANQLVVNEYDASGRITRQRFGNKDITFQPTVAGNRTENVVIDGRSAVKTTSTTTHALITRSYSTNAQLLNTLYTFYRDTAVTYSPPVLPPQTRRTQKDSFSVATPDNGSVMKSEIRSQVLDENGLLVRSNLPDGSYKTFTYDSRLRVTAEISRILDPVSGGFREYFVRNQYFQDRDLPTRTVTGETDVDSAVTLIEYDPVSHRKRFEKVLPNPSDPTTALTTEYRYDARGFLVEEIGPDGGATRIEYDNTPFGGANRIGMGFMTAKTDPMGHRKEWVNDRLGQPILERDAEGYETTFEYDGMGNIVSECDGEGICTRNTYRDSRLIRSEEGMAGGASGRVTRLEYDRDGRLSRKIREMEDGSENLIEQLIYDGDGRVVEETGNGGLVRRMGYDPLGRKVFEEDASGRRFRTFYDLNGNKYLEVDALGNRTEFQHDALGRLRKRVDAVNTQKPAGQQRFWLWEYDFQGREGKAINPLGQATLSRFDGLGRKIREIGVMGDTTLWEYAGTALASRRSPGGMRTRYAYDAAGRLVSRLEKSGDSRPTPDADDFHEEFVYDSRGKVLKEIRNGAAFRRLGYDASGRIIADTNGVGEVKAIAYHPTGEVKRIERSSGKHVNFAYDNMGRLIREWDALGDRRTHSYDSRGRLARTSMPGRGTVTHTYNASGGLVRTTDAAGAYQDFTLDANDQPIEIRDNLGNLRKITLNGLGMVVMDEDGRGKRTRRAYDDLERLVWIEDDEGNRTTFEYQEFDGGRREITRFPDNGVETKEFNRDGGLVATTATDGRHAQYRYDDLGALRQVLHPGGGPTLSYEVDARRRLTRAVKGGIQTEYTYDDADRVTSTVQTINGVSYTLSYSYNDAENSQTTLYPNGLEVTSEFDARGRLRRQRLGTEVLGEYQYAGFNIQAKILGNGLRANYSRDAAGNPTEITYSGSPAALPSYRVGYGPTGRIRSVRKSHQPGESELYEYDADYQMTASRRGTLDSQDGMPNPSSSESWTLDARGNWLQHSLGGSVFTGEYSSSNQLTTLNGQAITHDARGNLTQAPGLALDWDAEGNLAGANGAEYGYDPNGLRVFKQSAGITTRYILGHDRILYEASSDGTSKAYIYGAYIDEPIAMVRSVGASREVIYYLQGLNHNVEALADSDGEIIERYEYDPFGKARVFSASGPDEEWFTQDDQGASASAFGNTFLYHGRQLDSETGLYNFRRRYYSPVLGRFISRDPIRYEGGDINLYRFVANYPFSKDPFGLKCELLETQRREKARRRVPGAGPGPSRTVERERVLFNVGIAGRSKRPTSIEEMRDMDDAQLACWCIREAVGVMTKVLYEVLFQVTKKFKCCNGDECTKSCDTYTQESEEKRTTYIEEFEPYTPPIRISERLGAGMNSGCSCGDL